MTKILDCTTRDGGHITNWNFEEDYVFELIQTLNKLSVAYYEIGYRNHFNTENKGNFYKCSPNFLEKFYKVKENLQIGVMTDTTRYSSEDFPSAKNDKIDFVRIACHPEKIKEATTIAENLHDKGYKIFVQLMDVSNIDTSYEKLSFHGHNQINMAFENTLKAIELGAFSIDVTQNGIGRCGGNLDINQLRR